MSSTDIIKIQAIELQRSSSAIDYTLRVLGQLNGEQSFSWFRSDRVEKSALQRFIDEIMQQHIWNAPEDSRWLQDWKGKVDRWFDSSEQVLALHNDDVKPVVFSMMILQQRKCQS